MIDFDLGKKRDKYRYQKYLIEKARYDRRQSGFYNIILPSKDVSKQDWERLDVLNKKSDGAFGKLYRSLIMDKK
ncbi:hypothetical protein [Algivirga pacifica]|uniref:Uncharacterized protein n=1 Tax=Algivirga pacifica TaxID=1162670 RepID=A0ABP9DFM3_9BACT